MLTNKYLLEEGMRKFLALIVILLLAASFNFALDDARLLRFPNINNDLI